MKIYTKEIKQIVIDNNSVLGGEGCYEEEKVGVGNRMVEGRHGSMRVGFADKYLKAVKEITAERLRQEHG